MENHGSTERPRSTTQNPHPDEIMMPSSTAENQTRLVALSSEAESIPEKKACKEPPPYICFKCGNKFKFHHTLETHLEFHCKKSPRVKPRRSLNSKSLSDRYYCRKKTCNRSFSSEKSLIRHSRDCRASKAHACKFCDLRFTWKTQCQKHIFRKHSDQLEPEEENKENQSAIPLQASVSELEQQIPGVPEDDSLDPVPIQSVNNTCINEEENKVNNTLKRILSTDKPTVLSKKPSKAKGRSKEKNSNRNGEGGMKIVDESVSNVETETERDQTGQEMIVCCEAESGEGPSEGKAFYHPLIGEHRGEAMENPQMKSDSVKITCPECDRFVCSDYFDLHLKLICFHTHKYQYFSCHRCVDGHCMPMKEYLLHLHLEHGETLTLRDIEQLTKS